MALGMTPCLLRSAPVAGLLLASVNLSACEETTVLTEAEAEDALWRKLSPRHASVCTPYSGPRGSYDEEACEADRERQREAFSVSLDECSEGSTIVQQPNAVTCTLTYRRSADAKPRSRVVVFYEEGERWIAVPI